MKLIIAALAALLLVVLVRPASAQIPGTELTQVLVSRPQLESLLTRYEEASRGPYSSAVREDARRRADRVRARLADGDFHVGDRILLDVLGETALTDTFTVEPGRQVILPTIGPIPLQGVLRFELADYITGRLARFVRDPKVRARSLIRVMIAGSVTRQGFYTVPVDIPVDAVLMIAGGVAATADLEAISIERGRDVMYDGESLQEVISQGTTIDALGIQAGDRFKVEAQPVRNANPLQRFQAIQFLLQVPISLFALGKLIGL